VTVLAVLGVAGYFLLFRDAAPPPADPPPVEAAAPPPVAPAEPPPPPAPAGPTPEEIQTQIDRMIDERVKAMEAATRKQFDEQLKSLASQLDEARRLAAERAAAPPRPAEPVASAPPPAPAPTAGTPETAAGNPTATQPGSTSTGTPAVPIPSTGSAAPAPTGTAPPTTRPAGTGAQPPTTPPATQPATGTPTTQSPSGTPAASPGAGTPTTGAAAPPPAARPPEVKVGDLVDLGPGVIPPRRTGDLQANYPAQARRLNRTAVVRVSVLVDENGRVAQAALKDPRRAGFGFDEEALAAARRATFQPGTKNGVRVKMWYDLSINFTP
jgi:TonB family protein